MFKWNKKSRREDGLLHSGLFARLLCSFLYGDWTECNVHLGVFQFDMKHMAYAHERQSK